MTSHRLRRPGGAIAGGILAVLLARSLISATPQVRESQVASGTASLSGSVMSAGPSSRPVPRAIVQLAGAALGRSRAVVTDDSGHFEIGSLPAARVTVTASRHGFVTNEYGATVPGWAGMPVQLVAGATIEIAIHLTRTAVASGRIIDVRGRPLEGLRVFAIPAKDEVAVVRPRRQAGTTPMAVTDDRGIYRVFDLAPDAYQIVAVPSIASSSQAIGTRSRDEVDKMLAALRDRRTGDLDAPFSVGPPPLLRVMAPVFFPGTARRSSAVAVTLAAGEERLGLDFVLSPVPVASVDGTMFAAGPLPSNIEVNLVSPDLLGGATGLSDARPTLSQAPDDAGRFRYTNVVPGRYTLYARATDGSASGRTGAPPPTRATERTLFGVTEVDVNGEDVTGVTVVLQPGIRVAGRVAVFPARSPIPPERFRLALRPPTELVSWIIGGSLRAISPSPDGRFDFGLVAPGAYRLQAEPPAGTPGTWWARSAVAAGRDVLDGGINVQLGDADLSIDVTMTDRVSEVAGVLETPADAPAEGYTVILFPVDEYFWGLDSRRVRATRPATDGRFDFSGLPPGDYWIGAMIGGRPEGWQDAGFLAQLRRTSVAVTVVEGRRTTQDLKIGGGG
jgi:hypothetical protein